MLCLRKLPVLGRLQKFMDIDATCRLCNHTVQDLEHLFFKCWVTEPVIARCLHRVKIEQGDNSTMYMLLSEIQNHQVGKTQKQVKFVAIGILSYTIWKFRNKMIWENQTFDRHVVESTFAKFWHLQLVAISRKSGKFCNWQSCMA